MDLISFRAGALAPAAIARAAEEAGEAVILVERVGPFMR